MRRQLLMLPAYLYLRQSWLPFVSLPSAVRCLDCHVLHYEKKWNQEYGRQ
jgi:hypothetical protein